MKNLQKRAGAFIMAVIVLCGTVMPVYAQAATTAGEQTIREEQPEPSLTEGGTPILTEESASTGPEEKNPVPAPAEEEPASTEEDLIPARTEEEPVMDELTGSIIYMLEDSFTPEMTLYADGTPLEDAAAITEEEPFVDFPRQSYAYTELSAAAADGTEISYTIQPAAAPEGALLYAVWEDEVLEADADGRYPAGASFVYVAAADVAGTFMTDDPTLDLTALTLTSAAKAGTAAAAVTLDAEDGDAGRGTWMASGLPVYDPLTGVAQVYRTTVTANPNNYEIYYDNTAAGDEGTADCALNGGTIAVVTMPVVLLDEEPLEPVEYKVSLQALNFAVRDVVAFTADAALTSKGTLYNAGETIYVPAADSSFTLTYTPGEEDTEVPDITLTVLTGSSQEGAEQRYTAVSALTEERITLLPADTEGAAENNKFIVQEAVPETLLYKQWSDGDGSTRPDAEEMLNHLALQYKTDNDEEAEWELLTEDNMELFGYTNLPLISQAGQTGGSTDSTWTYAFNNNSNPLNQYLLVDGTPAAVTWRLAETTIPAGYYSSYVTDEEGNETATLLNTEKRAWEATIDWKDGSNKYATRLQIFDADGRVIPEKAQAFLADFTFSRSSIDDGKDRVPVELTAADKTAEGYVAFSLNDDGTWRMELPNALNYNSQNHPNNYALRERGLGRSDTDPDGLPTAEGSDVETGTTYVAGYDNTGNHASITAELYSGGTLTNTLSGTTQFTGTKIWKDDSAQATIAARPAAVLDLLRYPDNGANYTTGSPVPGVARKTLDNTAASGASISITIPDTATLPMYNEDGYKYIYYAKETLEGGSNAYKKIMTYPDSHTAVDADDMYLFAGGTLNNVITGTVDYSVTKMWKASARQDVNADVQIVLTQTDPDTKEEITFQAELTGFKAEISEMEHIFEGLPQYNDEGRPYTYTVKESSVSTVAGNEMTPAVILTEKEGEGAQEKDVTYIITADGYRYRQETVIDENDVNAPKATITNTLVGNAQVNINKTFSDGLLGEGNTQLIYTVYQNGTRIGTVTREYEQTGENTGKSFTPEAVMVTKYEDMDEGSYEDKTGFLPRYDENGVQYIYTITEAVASPTVNPYGTTITDSRGEGTYTAATENTGDPGIMEKYGISSARVNNYRPGNGVTIKITKEWKDDNDTLYHLPVHAALQYYRDGRWNTIQTGTIDTNADYIYMSVPNEEGSSYVNAYTDWETKGAPAGDAEGNFRVVETALGEYTVREDTTALQAAHPEHRAGNSFVETLNQNYDVSPTAKYEPTGSGERTRARDFTLTNTRVGVTKIVLTKHWRDGSDAGSTRPDSIRFTVKASQAVFDGVIEKTFTINAPQNTGHEADPNGEWKLDTGWLTKYDTEGKLISYTIEESADTIEALNKVHYVQELERVSYEIPQNHTGDVDSYICTNTLSDTVQPYMNKYWADAHDAAARSSRPDIYPVLIQGTLKEGVTLTPDEEYDEDNYDFKVMKFTERDWSTFIQETEDWWTCTFVPLERYDSEGREYIYYVGEKIAANDSEYYNSGAYTDEPETNDKNGEKVASFTEDEEKREAAIIAEELDGTMHTYDAVRLIITKDAGTGKETASAGTIVNKPKNGRMISGTKVWDNIPVGFKRSYLPDITFALKRYVQGQDESSAVYVKEDGTETVDKMEAAAAVLQSGQTAFAFEYRPAGRAVLMDGFPKYNDKGVPYVYIVEELSPEGIERAYAITNDTGHGLAVTNKYINDQSLTVTLEKKWSYPEAVKEYAEAEGHAAEVTFTLVRSLTSDAEGTEAIAGTEETSFDTIEDGDTVKNGNTKTVTYDGNGTATYTWEGLAYYAPNGNPYKYTLYETSVDGYKITVNGQEITSESEIAVNLTAPEYEGNDKKKDAAGTAQVITNTYGDVTGAVKVAKKWEGDTSYYYDTALRPTSVTLTLQRKVDTDNWENVADITLTADSADKGAEEYADVDLSSITVTHDTDSTADKWAAIVSGLQIYSTSGKQYTYQLVEKNDAVQDYTVTNSGTAIAKAENPVVLTVTNTRKTTTVTFTKNLKYQDSSKVPAAAGAWASIAAPFGAGTTELGAPRYANYCLVYKVGSEAGGQWQLLKTSADKVKTISTNYKNGTYDKKSFSSLPATIGGITVTYRCYEYSITYGKDTTIYRYAAAEGTPDDAALLAAINSSSVTAAIGSCIVSDENTAEEITGSTNTIPMKPITLVKVWDDELNRDGKRAAVTFTITRTNIYAGESGTGDGVTQSASVTLSAADVDESDTSGNTWKKTVYVPVYCNDSSTVCSSYTVSEAQVDGYDTPVITYTDSADNEKTGEAIGTLTAGTAAFTVTATNRRTARKIDITASKTWQFGSSSTSNLYSDELKKTYYEAIRSITFKLQYRTVGKTTSGWSDVPDTAARTVGTAFEGVNGNTEQTPAINAETGALSTAPQWSSLPAYVDNEIINDTVCYEYQVVEVQPDGSALKANFTVSGLPTVISGATASDTAVNPVVITNTFNTRALTVTKTWSDDDNTYHTRPDSIKFTVQYSENGKDWNNAAAMTGSDESWKMMELSAVPDAGNVNTWQATLSGLPACAPDGKAYSYQAANEELIYGGDSVSPGEGNVYTVSPVSGTSFTNTLNATSLTVTKTWKLNSTDADTNQFGTWPDRIEFAVERRADTATAWETYKPDGTNALTFTANVDKANGGALTGNMVSGLPRTSADGLTTYQYRAVEQAFLFGSGSGTTRVVVNGANIGAYCVTASLDSGNFESGYTTSVTNTLATGGIAVTKNWDDEEDRDGIRPDETGVTFTLTAATGGVTIPAANATAIARADTAPAKNWIASWSGLPLRDKTGSAVTYTVVETVPANYRITAPTDGKVNVTMLSSGTASASFTNQHVPERISLDVTKVFVEGDYTDMVRPSSVTFQLQKSVDGSTPVDVAGKTVTIDTADKATTSFTGQFTNLYKYEDGKLITYTVRETDTLSGYIGNLINGTSVENTMQTTQLTVNKIWQDDENYYTTRPDTYTVDVEYSIDGTKWTPLLTGQEIAADSSRVFTGLPQFDADNNPYLYRAVETEIGDTAITDSSTLACGYRNTDTQTTTQDAVNANDAIYKTSVTTLTNTLQTTVVTAVKVWKDHANADGTRPESVMLALYGNDVQLATANAKQPLTAADAEENAPDRWKITWDKLPCYDTDNDEITYTVRELDENGDPLQEGSTLKAGETGSYMVSYSDDELTVTNSKTSFSFVKTVSYLEAFYNAGTTAPLADAEFTLYTDKDCSTECMTALSDADGKISFNGLAAGDYYLKETAVPGTNTMLDETVRRVTIADTGEVTIDGIPAEQTTIVNDMYRGDIVLQKVSETDGTTPIANSVYGLYRNLTDEEMLARSKEPQNRSVWRRAVDALTAFAAGSSEVKVAEAATGADGILRFDGVLANVEYTIREEKAPAGSELSANPIRLTFTVDTDGNTNISSFDDGSGTAVLNADGSITWLEPQTRAIFYKKAEDGSLLAGAALRITDVNGNVVPGVDDWISTADGGHLIEGLLTAGETYLLQELSAPDGYELAEPLTFTMSSRTVAANENYVQEFELTNRKKPDSGSADSAKDDPAAASGVPHTSDKAPSGILLTLTVLSALVAGIAAYRRRKV